MHDQLVIYLRANDLANPWWVIDSAICYGEAERLSAVAKNRQVVVIIPAEDVVLILAKLPKMTRAQLLKALPFSLEEQLMTEVEKLHFVPSYVQTDNQLPVAIVAHEKMKQWLSLLQSWHIRPDVMIPLTLALPWEQRVWHVFLHEMAVVRIGEFAGFSCDKHNLAVFIQQAFKTQYPTPERLVLYHDKKEGYADGLDVAVAVDSVFLSADQMIKNLAKTAKIKSSTPFINLLQGAYAVKSYCFAHFKGSAKAVIYLMLSWLLVFFLYPVISCFILQSQLGVIENRMMRIYKHHFPEASRLVMPMQRMQEKLQTYSMQMNDNRLLLWLEAIGKEITGANSIQLKRVDFQNNKLILNVIAASQEAVSVFTDHLRQRGLNIEQQGTHFSDERMSVTLQIG